MVLLLFHIIIINVMKSDIYIKLLFDLNLNMMAVLTFMERNMMMTGHAMPNTIPMSSIPNNIIMT